MNKSNPDSFKLENMTWPEVENAMEKAECALIPIGSQEQHGPYIAESCDSRRAEKFAALLGEKLDPLALITPTISYGISPHHMNFPGTITLSPETLVSLLGDIVGSLHDHGLDRFVLVNGHGGNDDALGVAVDTIRTELPVRLLAFKYTSLAAEAIEAEVDSDFYGHACEREVSELMYMAPEIIRENRIEPGEEKELLSFKQHPVNLGVDFDEYTENGALGDARQASREKGEKIVETALAEAEKIVRDFLQLELPERN